MTPINEKVVAAKVETIRRMLKGIATLPLATEEEFTSDFRMVSAGESMLRRSLEALLDLGRHISAKTFSDAVVEYKQIGNSYLYWAKQSRDQMTRKEVKGFLDRVMDGAFSPFLANFIEESDLSKEEIARLKRILSEKETRG